MKCRVTVQLPDGGVIEGLWDECTTEGLDRIHDAFIDLHKGMTVSLTTEVTEQGMVKVFVPDRHITALQLEIIEDTTKVGKDDNDDATH